MEGYFDLILPFQNEIRNIVATLGTALTTEQIRTIFVQLSKAGGNVLATRATGKQKILG